MRNYERFQQVITYYLNSINASADFIKLKENEVKGKKHKGLTEKYKEFEKRKGKVINSLNTILNSEPEMVNKIEADLESINEDIRNFVREF